MSIDDDFGCPWCGEDVRIGWGDAARRMSYDSLLEAHVTECADAQAELGGEVE